MKTRALAVGAAMALSLAVAGSASAATWSTTGAVNANGSLTWQQGGGSTKVCGWSSNGTIFSTAGWWSGNVNGSCTSGGSVSGQEMLVPVTNPDGSVSVRLRAGAGLRTSPYGPWNQVDAVVPFVNGNASTPSKVVLDNTYVGYADGNSGQGLTVTGSINVTTANGGLVTINP